MKPINITLIALLFISTLSLQAQNLDKMREAKRNKTILKIAKESVMENGPDFYRDFAEPEITHGYVTNNNRQFDDEYYAKNPNRSYYVVKYLYNKEEEAFPEDYSAEVYMWGDTGVTFRIFWGTGIGRGGLDDPKTRGIREKVTWTKRPPGAFKTTIVIKTDPYGNVIEDKR